MLKRAKHYNNKELIEELERKLNPYIEEEIFHVSGFAHPQLLIYTNVKPNSPTSSTWGLVPAWVKDSDQKQKLWNKTINARGETMFEKPSFRSSAKSKRCLIYLDGFYEHHHKEGKTFPFYISRKDKEPLTIAGLWEEWMDKSSGELLTTFTIVTTKANSLLSKIHNNPKLPEPRMPLILTDEQAEEWLQAPDGDKYLLEEIIKSKAEGVLSAYTVNPIRGKSASGNHSTAIEPRKYEQLEFEFLE